MGIIKNWFGSKNEGSVSSPADPQKAEPLVVKPRVANAVRARYDRLKDWLRQNELKLAEATLNDDSWLSHHALAAYPAAKDGCLAYGGGCFAATDSKAPVYVLGDTHGDVDTFIAILDTILGMGKENGEKSPVVYLLGDIVDRNEEGCMLECALILAVLQKALPEEFAEFNSIRFAIVKGDHDIGLLYTEPYAEETRFKAMVSPADYCDWLNKRLDDGGGENVTKIGRAWIRLMKECPAAAFLEETGTLLSHGGVPREDLQKRVAAGEPYMLQSEAFAQDFEWCRMVDVKKKLLNRGSKTSEVGGYEFDSFCKTVFPSITASGKKTTKVRRFIFAHQHPVKGFEQYTKWYDGYQVICLASFRDESVFGGPTIPHFARIQPSGDVAEYDELAGKDAVRHIDEVVDVYRLDLSFEEDKSLSTSECKDEKAHVVSTEGPVDAVAAEADEKVVSTPASLDATPVAEKTVVAQSSSDVKMSESSLAPSTGFDADESEKEGPKKSTSGLPEEKFSESAEKPSAVNKDV